MTPFEGNKQVQGFFSAAREELPALSSVTSTLHGNNVESELLAEEHLKMAARLELPVLLLPAGPHTAPGMSQ